MSPIVVTIDGPAGSGKSTVAAGLARRLGVPHVDTGAYYRAATLAVLRAGADPAEPDAVLAALEGVRIERLGGRTLLDGEDVECEIRGAAVTAAVSTVSSHPRVRLRLLPLQRAAVDPGGAVVEGRDAGTAVAPHAPLKVWLTATVEERAARRAAQLREAGAESVAAHARRIARRDAADAGQMRPAEDVVSVDTTGLSVEQLVERLAALVRERAGSTRHAGGER